MKQHVQQHNAKAFKDESWYKSPIGFGSKASVVHAALKQLDARGTGFVRCHEIVEALQGCNFGASCICFVLSCTVCREFARQYILICRNLVCA